VTEPMDVHMAARIVAKAIGRENERIQKLRLGRLCCDRCRRERKELYRVLYWLTDVVGRHLSPEPTPQFRTPDAVKDAWGEVEQLAIDAGVDDKAWIAAVTAFWRVTNLASEPVCACPPDETCGGCPTTRRVNG